jgi:2-aminoadipate transaminase
MDIVLPPPRLARRVQRLKPSTIREMLKVTQNPDVISFGGGLPAAELFPVEDLSAAQDRVMRTRGAAALQYSVTDGIPELREWVARRMHAQYGVRVEADDVVITGGSQQGLDLYARVFLDPGDVVALENPSYLGAIQAFDAFEPRYLAIESDEHGIVPEHLETALAAADPRPKFLYLVPNYSNPTGKTLAAERRPRIVEICARHGVPILEDDPYGVIAFGDAAPAPLLARGAGAVTYLGTGSKMVAPGLRVAWMVIPDRDLRDMVVTAKQGADLHSSTYAQYVFHAYVEDDARLDAHLERVCTTYRARRDAMLAALAREMPAHVRWNVPDGGMFLWASVGDGIDTEELFERAVRDQVVFVPGRPFYPAKDRGDGMRLNFSAMPEQRIAEGIARLGRAVRQERA